MFSKKTMITFITYLIMAFTFFKPVFAADDDNTSNEVKTDIVVGIFMAICETSTTCTSVMRVVVAVVLVLGLIMLILYPKIFFEVCCNTKNLRRGATSYTAYRVTRSLT
jgi:hypothetical protein